MNLERQLRSANRTLAEYCPPHQPGQVPPGPYLQWCFSEPDVYDHLCPPLWFVSHAPNPFNNEAPILDNFCNCGVNVQEHAEGCKGFTIPKIRMVRVKSEPGLDRVWVLCRWIAPCPEAVWQDMYGTLDNYPRNGRYLGVQVNGKYVTFPEEHPPFPETSKAVVCMFKQNDEMGEQIRRTEDERRAAREWVPPKLAHSRSDGTLPDGTPILGSTVVDPHATPPPGSNFARFKDFFKNKFTTYGQIPGSKGSVSYPSTTESE